MAIRRNQYVRWQQKRSFQTLAGVAVTIPDNFLSQITVAAEQALQEVAITVAENAKRNIRKDIKRMWPEMQDRPYSDGDIIDTGALYESVYVAYPGSQQVQTEFRRTSRKTQASKAFSYQSMKGFRKAVRGAIKKNKGIAYGAKNLGANGRFDSGDEPAETLTQRLIDTPINEFVKTHRANLYVSVAVAAAHGIFPHEGRKSGRGGPVPARPFFAPNIEKMQRDFQNKVGNLENYMTKRGIKRS